MALTFFDRYLNSRQVAIFLSGLCLLLGTSGLIGWHLKIPTLIQVMPEFVPMQYNTALGFVITGSGIALSVTKNIQLARISAVFLILLGSMTLLQFIASVNLGIDQLFMEHYITVETSDPGRMAPNTALGFSLSGIALLAGLVSSNRTRYQFIEGILGALVIGLGVVALTGYIVGLEPAYGWGQLTQMAVHTASGFVLAGFAVTAAAWYKDDDQTILFPNWLPVVVFIAVMTVTVSLWQAFVVQEIKHSPYEKNIEVIIHYSLLPFGFLLALALGVSLHLIRFAWIKNHEALTALYQSRTEITERKQAEFREKSRTHVLELITNGEPLPVILDAIVRVVEQEKPNMLCSILLLDDAGKHLLKGAAPSLPDFYNKAIHGVEIGIGVGSCGTAAFINERVIVDDIQTHPYWTPYKELASKAKLGACWSEPIRSTKGGVLGTFAIYHRNPHSPSEADVRLIKQTASLASIAIERTQSQLALKGREARLSHHINNTPLAAITWDKNFHVTEWNKTAEKIFGYSADEAIGKQATDLILDAASKAHVDQVFKALLKNKGGQRSSNENVTKDGRTIFCEWYNTSILDESGELIAVSSLVEDVTDRKESETMIWKQANFDTLTGLANRRMANDRLEQEIKIADRSNKSIAVIFFDLDGFKDINDTLGHDVGDKFLVQVAKRLQSHIRDVDTIARFGGDEFLIIMGGLESLDPVDQIANELLKNIAEPFILGDATAHISTSVGITFYPQDAATPIEMLKNADQAMYAAKNNGGNSFQYFTPSMQQGALARMSLISDLRKAIENNEFQLYYQPIVNLLDGTIHKAEALIRWQHPEKGLIGPIEFIPIAEETKLIMGIGDWVFREACRQSSLWRTSFNPNFQISINTSPIQYKHNSFSAKDWLDHMQAIKLSGDAIAVEITEGTLMESGTSIDQILFAFRDANIQVSLDDFGTGYSSLSSLKKLDIDYLKIDKSFVDNLAPSSSDLALCEAIIVMAHKLGLKVVAEGIETTQQRDLLVAAGCDYGQGYLFSKPVAAMEFETLLSPENKATVFQS